MIAKLKYLSFLALFSFVFCHSVEAKDNYSVLVEKAPPVVMQRVFDLGNPPQDLPPLNPGEKGITQAVFDMVVNFDVKVVSNQKTETGFEVVMRPKKTRIKLSLPITIWIPEGAPEKFLRHEQGHNFINQQVYESADMVVKFFALTMGDSRYKGIGKNYDEALVNAYKQAGDELNSLYRRYVHGYSMCVGGEYDKLTRHGLNNFPETTAIEQAFDNCNAYKEEFDEIKAYFVGRPESAAEPNKSSSSDKK